MLQRKVFSELDRANWPSGLSAAGGYRDLFGGRPARITPEFTIDWAVRRRLAQLAPIWDEVGGCRWWPGGGRHLRPRNYVARTSSGPDHPTAL